MNRKVFVVLLNTFLLIKCEDNPEVPLNETQESTVVSANVLPQTNQTNPVREGKQDVLGILGDAISAAAAAAAGAASSSVVDQVFGNQLIRTGEYCGYRRSNRFCDEYCHDSFKGPMVGYCRSGMCVCECDYYECERYCRRYWDDLYDNDYDGYDVYDYPKRRRNPISSRRVRGQAYCSLRGCRCD